jgi:hypothetical protein
MIARDSFSHEGRANTAAMERRSGSLAPRSAHLPASGSDVLAELLSSRVRAAVLGFLVAREDARFSLTELARHLELPISSVQHECYKLERLKVLRGRREGVSRRYWLDHDTPFVRVLIDLVIAVVGREQLLAYAMADFAGLHGALLMVASTPSLVLVGELGLEELEAAQERTAAIFAVSVNAVDLAFFRPAEWQEHCADDHPFVQRLRQSEVTVVMGDDTVWPA